MSLTKPILRSIPPFPATSAKAFNFDVFGGAQVIYNQLEIQKNSDNTQIYLSKVQSFQYVHNVSAGTLTNGIEYKARVRTYDVNNVTPSDWSNWVVFWALAVPTVAITNIPDNIVNNQTFTFEGSYTHSGDTLESYRFLLYDSNQTLLQTFNEQFGTPISQEVAGLENDQTHHIELITLSAKGMSGTSGKIQFLAQYIQPRLSSILTLENMPDQAAIKITANVIQIIFESTEGAYSFEDDDWVNLSSGVITASAPFRVERDFTLKLWCKSLPINYSFLVLTGEQGTISLKYYDDRIWLFKTAGTTTYTIFSDELTDLLSTDVVGIAIRHSNNRCDLLVEIIV